MDKSTMLECLINYYTNGNKAAFAAMIGVKPQTISAWISRNTFDNEQIYAKCNDVSADWLLTGEGEMIRKDRDNVDISNIEHSELLELCKSLIQNYKQHDDIIMRLVSIIK